MGLTKGDGAKPRIKAMAQSARFAIAWFGDWAIAFVLLLYCNNLLLLKQARYYKIFKTLQNKVNTVITDLDF